jgi:hypothetical protein
MAYKIMIIDDRAEREALYKESICYPLFDPIFIFSKVDFDKKIEIPVDGYIVDVFLDNGDWNYTNAAKIINEIIKLSPRSAPIFIVSQRWGDDDVLDILKQIGDYSSKILQYLAWSEFEHQSDKFSGGAGRIEALQRKLSSELDRWHGRCTSFRPGPDDTIRILLIADPQFGDPDTDPKATFAEHWIARKLRNDYRTHGIPLPDLMVLAGDITHSGRPDQYILAEERILHDLIGPLWGENNLERRRDRIIIVPGNHDVNLRFSAADGHIFNPSTKKFEEDALRVDRIEREYSSHHEYALDPFRRFAYRLTGDRNWLDIISMSWVDRRFMHCGIRFFILNTVSELDAVSPQRGCFSEAATRAITRSLADDDPSSIFSLAISHHGLRPDGMENETQVDNWTEVGSDFFAMHSIRLWLYGHYHAFNRRAIHGRPFDQVPLWMVQIPTLRVWPSTRGFCVLELNRENNIVTNAEVYQYILENGRPERKDGVSVF